MSRCLLVENREKISALYSLNLKVYVGVDIILKKTLDEAIKFLDIVPEIDVIVVRSKMAGEKTALKLFEYVEKLALPIPIVVIGEEKSLEGKVKMLNTAIEVGVLVPAVSKILGVTAKDMASQILPSYYQIPLKYFLQLNFSSCDIYIQILKKDTTPQYVKLINKGEKINFTHQSITRYLNKGVKEFYIPTPLRIEFVKCFTSQIIDKIYMEDLSISDRIKVTEVSLDFVSSEVFSNQLTEEVVSVAKAGIYSMIRLTEQTGASRLRDILRILMHDKSSLRYMLAQIITFLACHAINEMEWGTKEQRQKIGYMAFFHDVLLRSDDLAMIFSDEELKNADINEEDKKLVYNHAVWTLEYLNDYPEVEYGANILIKQHHGSTNGVGFPRTFSSSISPLAIVFIASEHYARELVRFQKGDVEFCHYDIVQKLDESLMAKSKYRKIIESFEKFFSTSKFSS